MFSRSGPKKTLGDHFWESLSDRDKTIAEVIKDCIEHGQVLSLDYDGTHRLVEPHALGLSTAFHLVMRAYQVRGESKVSEEPEGWKLFDISKIGDYLYPVSVMSGAPREDFRKADKAMTHIFKEL